MRLTVVGCGALGVRIVSLWTGPIVGVTATTARHASLRDRFPRLHCTTHVDELTGASVICMPSSQQGAFLDTAPPVEGPVVFTSSTGVYGEPEGLVTAESPTGTTDRALRLLELEARFFAWAPHGRVLRLGGLYEQGRGPQASFERKRTVPPGPAARPLALIHYADAARLVLRLLTAPGPAITLGVVHQPSRRAFYTELAARFGVDPPVFSEPTEPQASFRYQAADLADPQPW